MRLYVRLVFDIHTGNKPLTIVPFESSYSDKIITVWKKAGVYPDIVAKEEYKAFQLLDLFSRGLEHMRVNTLDYRAKVSMADYYSAMKLLGKLTQACMDYPEATLEIYQ